MTTQPLKQDPVTLRDIFQIGDFCHSPIFNTEHPLFARLMIIAGKITDICDGKFKIRLLTGEKVELSENESLMARCSTEDFLSQAGYLLEVEKMEYQKILGEIHDTKANITYNIPGALTESELNAKQAELEKVIQNMDDLREIYRDLGILRNFQEVLS